jgi:hypothetical protein
MATPVYEVGIYTYKSRLEFDPADIIAVRDISGTTTSIGINTIGDYDKYYISDNSYTHSQHFYGKSAAATIEDAYDQNAYQGGVISETITNSFKVTKGDIRIPGYDRVAPLIVGATLTVNSTFTPKVNTFTGSLTVPYLATLSVLSSTLNVKLFQSFRPTIKNIYYFCQVGIKDGNNNYLTVPQYHPLDETRFGPSNCFNYPSAFSIAHPRSQDTRVDLAIINPQGQFVATLNSAFIGTGNHGWGKLPQLCVDGIITDVDKYFLPDMYFNLITSGVLTGQLSVLVNGTEIVLVTAADALSNAKSQFRTPGIRSITSFNGYRLGFLRGDNDSGSFNSIDYTFRREVSGVNLVFEYQDGTMSSVYPRLENLGKSQIASIIQDRPDGNTTLGNVASAVNTFADEIRRRPLRGDSAIPANITQCIKANQGIQLRQFTGDSNGIYARDTETNAQYTLVNQSALISYYNTRVQTTSVPGEVGDVEGTIYVDVSGGSMTATIKYGDQPSSSVITTPNLSTASFNVSTGGNDAKLITTSNNLSFYYFLQTVLRSNTFSNNRTLNLTTQTNGLTWNSEGTAIFSFADLMTNLVAKPRDTWSLSFTYRTDRVPSGAYWYSNGSNMFPRIETHSFTSGFTSGGALVNGTVPRYPDDQILQLYRSYNVKSVAEKWVTGNNVAIPSLLVNMPTFGINPQGDIGAYSGVFSVLLRLSFVGDPANYDTYTLTNTTGATLISASLSSLTYPGNATQRTFDLTTFLQASLGLGITLSATDFISSFNSSTNIIGAANLQLPIDFYVPGITGATLSVNYNWGDEYNYDEYAETFPLSTMSTVEVNQSNLSNPSTTVSLFNKADRQRLIQTSNNTLYFVTISSNPTGYTFSVTPFPVKSWDPALPYSYKIHRMGSLLDWGYDATMLLNINDNLDRTKPVNFLSTPYSSQVNTLTSVGGQFGIYGATLTSFLMTGQEVTVPLVNKFLRFDNTSTTNKNQSLYLFVTPQLADTLARPDIAAGQINPYYMPEYTGYVPDTVGRTGIPTFGATLHGIRDYIITNSLASAISVLGTDETGTSTPFSTFSNTVSDQIAGFLAHDYRYKFFSVTSDTDANTSLYAVPFNWRGSGSNYDIAYANNFIILNYENINPRFVNTDLSITNSYAPTIVAQPLYFDITSGVTYANFTELSQDPTVNKGIRSISLRNKLGTAVAILTKTGDTYAREFISRAFIPGQIYSDYDDPIIFQVELEQRDSLLRFVTLNYQLRRFYVPASLTVTSASTFLSAIFQSTAQLFRTNIIFNLTLGGSIAYAGTNITGFGDSLSRFALIIPGIADVPFDIASNGSASVLLPHLLPETVYDNLSIRYYPYRSTTFNISLRNLSEVAPLTGFSFTTPAGYVFRANCDLAYNTANDRACLMTVSSASLRSGLDSLDITNYQLVLDIGKNARLASGALVGYGGVLVVPATTPITFYVTELKRGDVLNPVVYLQKIDGMTYKSNIVLTPIITVPTRPNITIEASGALIYKKNVSLTNFDVYERFLEDDFSLPDNFGGTLQILLSTTFSYGASFAITTVPSISFNHGSMDVSGKTPSFFFDLNKIQALTTTTLTNRYVVAYSRAPYVQTARTQITFSDSTGARRESDLTGAEVPNIGSLFASLGGVPMPPLNQNTVLYGPIVARAYRSNVTCDRINIAVNTPAGLVTLVENLISNSLTTVYDPTGLYTLCEGVDATVLSAISSDRLDARGNTGNNYYLNTYTQQPLGTGMGTVGLTYASGAVYGGLEFNEFYTKVIALKYGEVPIFITYLDTAGVNLSNYLQLHVGFTADACIYDGYSLEIAHPEDLIDRIAVYRDHFPTERDDNGVPTYRLDDFFSRLSHFTVYFEEQSQIDAWISSPVSDYWWTSASAKLKKCPFQILNKVTAVARVPPVTVQPKKHEMEGQVIITPAIFYGEVRVNNFKYYSVDSVNNSFPVVYNGGTLSLVDSTGKVYGTSTVQPTYASDVVIKLDKFMLTEETTYYLTLQYRYTDANILGTATLPIIYDVPDDETNIKLYTANELIHKLNVRIEPGNTFGNVLLHEIPVPSKLTLENKGRFEYQPVTWEAGRTYNSGDVVLWDARLFWLTDMTKYGPGEPKYGYGWSDTSKYIKYVGEWFPGIILTRNDVLYYEGNLYKVGMRDAELPTTPPLTLDRNTGLYSDYSRDILDQNIIIPFPYAGVTALNYTFDECIPDSTYTLYYSLQVGDTFTSLITLGEYTTLPTILDCQGVTFDGSILTMTDVSYPGGAYFNDGVMNYAGSSYPFGGTGTTISYSGDISDVNVTYTPQLSLDTGIFDETDPYAVYPVGLTLGCLISGPTLTHNSAIFDIINFNPYPFTLNTADYIGLFHGSTFWSELSLANTLIENDHVTFQLPINGLQSIQYYEGFNFQYRLNNKHYYTGVPVQLPPFTTPPILVIRLSVSTGATVMSARIREITYASNVLPSFFPVTSLQNNISMTFKSVASLKTTTPLFTLPGSITSNTSPTVFIPLKQTISAGYILDFVYIEYTFVDESGTLTTLVLESQVPSFVRSPVTLFLAI